MALKYYNVGVNTMSKKKKRFIPGEIRAINYDLFHNGLYKQKIIKNKKKEQDNRKKFKLSKENSYYLNVFLECA